MTARKVFRKFSASALIAAMLVLTLPGVAQEGDTQGAGTQEGQTQEAAAAGGPDFGLGRGRGVKSFTDPATGETETYQSLSLKPDLALGKFGVGLDLTLNYRFTGGEAGNEFEVREEDWVPDEETNFFELYLPKIQYVRWARKGDPLYVKLGSLTNARLGNSFIVGGYSNTMFLPDRRIFGLTFDLDGRLFDFPYVGMETLVSNLAAFDLAGGRLFVRPLVSTDIPIIKNLQLGTTLVGDFNPYYHARRNPGFTGPDEAPDDVYVWGADFRQPILSTDVISLAGYGDFVTQNEARGGMLGAGGRLIRFITYEAQLRFLGDNFIPVYFDRSYDLFRAQKYDVYQSEDVVIEGHVGWLAGLGFSILDDRLVFNASMEGPFGSKAGAYPSLTTTLALNEGLVPGVTLQAHYEQQEIREPADVFSAENAVIGAQLNYQTGPAVISLIYDLQYDPYAEDDTPWNVSSRLETSISLF